MSHYRAYIIGQDGHFIKSVILDCDNDDAAIESAKQLVDGHDVGALAIGPANSEV